MDPSNKPLISVVIPTYNYGGYVARAMESCLAQSHPQVEIIVVDDGSTDDTAAVVQAYAAQHPGKIRYVAQANQGVSAARNRGVEEAKGEFLAFLDADDRLTPDGLELRLAVFREYPDIGIVMTEKYNCHDGVTLEYKPRVSEDIHSDHLYQQLLTKKISAAVNTVLVRTAQARQFRFPLHLRTGEDTVYLAKLLFSTPAYFLAKPTVIMHYHPDSLRHDGAAAKIQRHSLVETIFDDPSYGGKLEPLRVAFASDEYFYVFKQLYKAGAYDEAAAYYRKAIAVRPWPNLLELKPLLRYVRINCVLWLRAVMMWARRR
jgi:glycosyltransferase involved in cell wall biosynthesis